MESKPVINYNGSVTELISVLLHSSSTQFESLSLDQHNPFSEKKTLHNVAYTLSGTKLNTKSTPEEPTLHRLPFCPVQS